MASEQQMDQVMQQIGTAADLEDFMNYYEFDEGEKQAARAEWQQNQYQNQNQVQDRGLGKLLIGGFALKKIFGRKQCGGKKAAWRPGMSRNMNMAGAGAGMGMGMQQGQGQPYNPNVSMGFQQNQCFQSPQPYGHPQQAWGAQQQQAWGSQQQQPQQAWGSNQYGHMNQQPMGHPQQQGYIPPY